MQWGKPGLVSAQFLATDAFENRTWLGWCDGEAHVVGFAEIPLTIASELKPADTKLEQVLIALQRLNPNAIDGDNINRIKAGAVLTLPDAETIKAIDAADASDSDSTPSIGINTFSPAHDDISCSVIPFASFPNTSAYLSSSLTSSSVVDSSSSVKKYGL